MSESVYAKSAESDCECASLRIMRTALHYGIVQDTRGGPPPPTALGKRKSQGGDFWGQEWG